MKSRNDLDVPRISNQKDFQKTYGRLTDIRKKMSNYLEKNKNASEHDQDDYRHYKSLIKEAKLVCQALIDWSKNNPIKKDREERTFEGLQKSLAEIERLDLDAKTMTIVRKPISKDKLSKIKSKLVVKNFLETHITSLEIDKMVKVMGRLNREFMRSGKFNRVEFQKAHKGFIKHAEILELSLSNMAKDAQAKITERLEETRDIVGGFLDNLKDVLVIPAPLKAKPVEEIHTPEPTPSHVHETSLIVLPPAKKTLVEVEVKKIQELLKDITKNLYKNNPKLNTVEVLGIFEKLNEAARDYKKSPMDRAAFNILNSEYTSIIKGSKKIIDKMHDPILTRLYNSVIEVFTTFFGWLDKLQSTVRKTPMLADDTQRARWFVKAETPVQTAKEQLHGAFGILDAALKDAREVVNEIKTDEYLPTPGSQKAG